MRVVRWLQNLGRVYFVLAGLLFNLFWVASLWSFWKNQPGLELFDSALAIFEPLQNVETCSRLMRGRPFEFERESKFQAPDARGRGRELILLGPRSFKNGKTREQNWIVSSPIKSAGASSSPAQILSFELDAQGRIARCLPSPTSRNARMTECLAAAGDYEGDGNCLVSVQMTSDCELMGGLLQTGQICRVPRHGLILPPHHQ